MGARLAPHPTDQILYAYGLGKLDDPAASAVDVHLETCPACRQRVSALSADSLVGRLRDAGARPGIPAPDPVPRPPPPAGLSKDSAPDPALAATLPPELASNPQYEILRELGRGGMGVVYLARNTLMDRLEVLKVLNKEMLERKGTYDRFLREVRAAARLNHPNVVGAYSALQIGGLLVFAMEYVEGADLARMVNSKGPLPVAHASYFVHLAALGLQHAHERGMVHRDIKPGNLMLTRQGQRGIVKVLDFGLAKATSENPIDGGLTGEGQMLGTPDYIAPEQTLDAQKADIRADIYSLGCTLYYLLSGGPPFQGRSLFELLQSHHTVEARPLNIVRPEVPVALAAVVGKMMAKERHRRYQTPAEVAEALKPFCKVAKPRSGSDDGEFSLADPPPVAARAAAPPPAPAAVPGNADRPDSPTLRWGSLITISERAELPEAKAKSGASGSSWPRPGSVRPALAAGAALVFVIACTVGVYRLRTAEVRPLPSGVPQPKPPDAFVGLFNGKDLQGWKTHPSQRGSWRVENGILIGSGPRADGRISYLYTDRNDFRDFQLRVEARINNDGHGGVYFRSTYGPTWPAQSPCFPMGYEARIKIKHGISDYTGSLFATGDALLGSRRESRVSQFEFFTFEVIARGNHIVIRVNERTTADYIDPHSRYTSGHIALQQLGSATVVEFRKIEIKELPESIASDSPAATAPETITNNLGMKLVLIPVGEFLMGSPDSDPAAEVNEKPPHKVRITRPFYLGATEVTLGQFRRFVESTGYRTDAETDGKSNLGWNEAKAPGEHDAKYTWRNPGFPQTDEHPVVNVSWNHAIAFCNKLSEQEGLKPYYQSTGGLHPGGDGYRLPTEAEWEYACRARTTTRYESGDDPETLSTVGNVADGTAKAKYSDWINAITARDGYVYTAPVGRFRANAFGLYDMHGNVWEWCWDGYQVDYYKRSPSADPPGASAGAFRVYRGGGWLRYPLDCRSAVRHSILSRGRGCNLGFRVARDQSNR